jgi:hypothetical protein
MPETVASVTATITRDYLDAKLDAQAETIAGLRNYIGDTPGQVDVLKQIVTALRAHLDAVILAHNELHHARDKHVDDMFKGARDAVAAALASADRAVTKAELASEKRFEGVNEFRASLADQGRLQMPRSEAEQRINALDEKIIDLLKRQAALEDRGRGKGEGWSQLVSIVALMASLVSIAVILIRL